jgi:hypothetical protein
MVLGIDKNTGAVSEIKSAIGLLVQDSARYIDTVFVVDNSTGYNFNKEYSEPAGAGGQLEFEIVLGESNSGHQYRKLVTTMTIDFEAQVDIVATISTDDGRSKTFVLKPEKRNKPLSVNLFGRSFVVRVYEKSPYAFRLNEVTLEGQFHGSQV